MKDKLTEEVEVIVLSEEDAMRFYKALMGEEEKLIADEELQEDYTPNRMRGRRKVDRAKRIDEMFE